MVRIRPAYTILTALAVAAAGCSPTPDRAAPPPTTVTQAPTSVAARAVTVATGLNVPVAFTFAADGRIIYVERSTGRVGILDPADGTDRTFFRVPDVTADGERGTLGVALPPGWPADPSVYVYATRDLGGTLENQVLRIHAGGGTGPGFDVLLRSPVAAATNHNGGRIAFGPDGKLYAVVGENADPAAAQSLPDDPRGKVLRLNPDGSVPADNPFGTAVWSFGLRNSFGFTFDPATGALWETENGPECNDEINLIRRGGNYAWGPEESCGGSSPRDTNASGPEPRVLPLWFTVPTLALTGDAFCDACGIPGLDGRLLFGAANDGVIRVATLNDARDAIVGVAPLLTAPGRVVYSMETGPDGSVYFSDTEGIYRLAAG